MNKILRTILFIIIILELLCADYYLVYQAGPGLAQENIENIEYCILPDAIYKKKEYFEKIFELPNNIKKASIVTNIVFTDRGSYLITKNKVLPITKKFPTNLKNNIPQNKILIKAKISQIYIIEDLDQDGQKEIVFKWLNRLRLGKIAGDIVGFITPGEEKNTILKPIENNKLLLRYKNKEYFFHKEDTTWTKTSSPKDQLLNPDKLKKLSVQELEYLRFEIAARHGKIFENQEAQKYFNRQEWYKPNLYFSEKLLNEIEKTNIKLLYKIEGEKRRSTLKATPRIEIPEK